MEHFPPASVQQINRDPSPGSTDNAGRDRDSRRDDRPSNRNKNGRNRFQSPANNNNNNNKRPPRDGPVDPETLGLPSTDHSLRHQTANSHLEITRTVTGHPHLLHIVTNDHNSTVTSHLTVDRHNSSGPSHQHAPRWQQRSQTPPPRWPDRRPGTPPPAGYRDYQPRQYFNSITRMLHSHLQEVTTDRLGITHFHFADAQRVV